MPGIFAHVFKNKIPALLAPKLRGPQEHSLGICAVGTAFFDALGREYSLSIPVPAARFAGKQAMLAKLLKKTKAELLDKLGRS